jgi:hypothetical protein
MGFLDNLITSNNEVATKKSLSLLDFGKDSSQFTDQRDFSSSSVLTTSDSRSYSNQTSDVYNPIDNRSLTLVLNSSGANTSTKKDIAQSSTPTFANTPSTSIIPTLDIQKTTESLQGITNGLDLGKYALYAGLAVGGFFVLKKTPFGKKILGGKK